MFGCHSCKYDLSQYKTYEQSPCSKCKAEKNPPLMSNYTDDPATFAINTVQHPAYVGTLDEESGWGMSRGGMLELIAALGEALDLLIGMKEQYPETYKFVNAKMHEPGLTYSQLADRFSCRKQNVLYHLKKAVRIAPVLEKALIVDNRFSRGCYAVHRPLHMQRQGGEAAR